MLQAVPENLMPAWTGGGGGGRTLPLRTSHLSKGTVSSFCSPRVVTQFSIKTSAGLHGEPWAWLLEPTRRGQFQSSSGCKGQTPPSRK